MMTQEEARAASAMVPIEKQIADAARELKMRETNYPSWVREGRMTQAAADAQIAAAAAIIGTLRVAAGPPPQGSIFELFESAPGRAGGGSRGR